MEKKERNLSISTMVIIMAIIFFVFKCERSTAQTWQHHLVEEGYLKIDLKSERLEKIKYARICKKLGIDEGRVIRTWKYSNVWTFNEKPHYFHKYESYIPVTLEQLNKTKINILGKEVNVLSEKERNLYEPQID